MRRAFLIALLLTAAAACSKEKPAAPPKPATVEHPRAENDLTTVRLTPEAIARLGIETEVARAQPAAGTRTIGGEVTVPEGRRVQVTAPTSGVLVSGRVRGGATVAAGEPLFRLTPLNPAERDQSPEAKRAFEAAQAEEQVARQRLERLEGLLAEGATSVRAVEEARAQLAIASAALEAAADRRSALARSSIGPHGDITISAPFAGTVLSVSAAQGQAVAASAPLVEIAQASTLWVKVAVYAGDVDTIDGSQPAAVAKLGAATTLLAEPVSGPPSANPNAASVDLFYELQGDGSRFRSGERVMVELPLRSAETALAVPVAALLYDISGGTWIYEDLGNGAYARRRVEVARHAGNVVVVSRGIAEGVKVVTQGAAELFGTEFGAGH